MENENIVKETALSVAKETAKDVYADTVQPTAKNVGGFFGTLSGFFNHVVMYPLKKLNIRYEQKAIAFEKEMEHKYNSIPEKERVEPQLHIVGPTMESLKYNIIPCNWVMKRIKYLFHIKKDIAGKEGYTVLSITQRGIQPKDLSKNEGQIAANYSQYQLLAPGDFAMNHMDLLTGWVDISKYSGVTSPDYRVFVLDDTEKNDSSYYLYLMQMCYFNRIFYGLGQGVSGMGRWRLQADKFMNFPVVVPPVDEQKEIVSYLNGITSVNITSLCEMEQWKF